LDWDGKSWNWAASGDLSHSGEATVSVIVDAQNALLVLTERSGNKKQWLLLERAAQPERWMDLRRAVFGLARDAQSPGVQSSPQLAPTEKVSS
jgi:hypothetical protein